MDSSQACLVLTSFVLRGRRVEAHSLAADLAALDDLCDPQFSLAVNAATGQVVMSREFPPEEQLESAAARVRPITLNGDPVYWGKALNALGFLLHESPTGQQYQSLVGELRKAWRDETESAPSTTVHVANSAGNLASADDPTLARAWLYGDVIHADPEHIDATRDFGVRQRYFAAVPFVARLLRLTVITVGLVRHLVAESVIELPGAVFEGDVVVPGTRWEAVGRAYTAPVGTEPPTDVTAAIAEGVTAMQRGDLAPDAAFDERSA